MTKWHFLVLCCLLLLLAGSHLVYAQAVVEMEELVEDTDTINNAPISQIDEEQEFGDRDESDELDDDNLIHEEDLVEPDLDSEQLIDGEDLEDGDDEEPIDDTEQPTYHIPPGLTKRFSSDYIQDVLGQGLTVGDAVKVGVQARLALRAGANEEDIQAWVDKVANGSDSAENVAAALRALRQKSGPPANGKAKKQWSDNSSDEGASENDEDNNYTFTSKTKGDKSTLQKVKEEPVKEKKNKEKKVNKAKETGKKSAPGQVKTKSAKK